ncbi:MAG: hypothetical protein Ct9H90mP18_09350 [Gammaproteobacteria bacterium]|nr:MAG: hypothetical protein Ct9H90mP18_09350 [Gammaproteobacteria bacterium]
MALPRLNNWSFWILPFAFTMLLSTLFFESGGPAAGWTFIPIIITGRKFYAFVIFSLHLLGASSILGAINVIATILNMRAPGMTLMKMPIFVWTLGKNAFLLIALCRTSWCITMLLRTDFMELVSLQLPVVETLFYSSIYSGSLVILKFTF